MLRIFGIISSLAILVWLAITRFTIMEGYYASRPLAQIIVIVMMLLYLVGAGAIFLGLKSFVKTAGVFLTMLFAASVVWAFFDIGLNWNNMLLLILQAFNVIVVIALYKKSSKSQGPSVLDMPIFG